MHDSFNDVLVYVGGFNQAEGVILVPNFKQFIHHILLCGYPPWHMLNNAIKQVEPNMEFLRALF